MPYLLQVNDLNVQRGSQLVLTNISLSIKNDEIITIIGPNGAGKSSLVMAILGLIPIKTGKVSFGKNVRIGYMPQKLNISKHLPITVLRFLELLSNNQLNFNLLEDLGIKHLLKKSLQNISGGEMQRILLAQALLRQPNLLILDEPNQALDIIGQAELYKLIANIKKKYQCGILLISHDLHMVMVNTTTVVCLNKHICCVGSPEIVSKHPEFINLFGHNIVNPLALYQHNHDHKHSLDGSIDHDK